MLDFRDLENVTERVNFIRPRNTKESGRKFLDHDYCELKGVRSKDSVSLFYESFDRDLNRVKARNLFISLSLSLSE